jgi:16S rRNA (guanine527-N7)-methyltransferase
MNKEEFINYCKELNINIDELMYNKLYKYYELLKEWNNKFNMTTILEEKDVFLLHFYDSLCLVKAVDLTKEYSLCDFGTGAGFPGMIIALLYPNINVTLIESNQKKCVFLEEIKKQLEIKNVKVINDRMENYSSKKIECFDIITCRAVTSIPILIEICIQSLKVNGLLVPLKSNCNEEIEKYKYQEKELNIKLINKIDYYLPINNASRTIPVYLKLGKTNKKYPRNYSTIIKMYK